MFANDIVRLTADPVVRTAGERQITTFRFASDVPFDRKREQTVFMDAVIFPETPAKVFAEHFAKGDLVSINGYIRARKWVNKDGEEKEKLEFNVANWKFAGTKKKPQQRQESEEGFDEVPF